MMNTTPLPAFLRHRDGRLELVMHCTWAQDHDLCAQKFWLRYGEQVEGTGPRSALNYGGAVHEALRLRYTNLDLSLEDVETVQCDALQGWFDACPQPSDEWRNAARAQDLIRAYNAACPAHDWQVLAVEEEFEVEVGEVMQQVSNSQIRVLVYLAGRKDLVVAWHDGLWVADHKTTQEWGRGDTNAQMDEGRMSFQFRGYAWAEREAQRARAINAKHEGPDSKRDMLPVLGTIGNYLVSRKPFATERGASKSTTPRNEFHMECYPFDGEALDEWRDECLALAKEVIGKWQRGGAVGDMAHPTAFRRHRGACGHWGRCEFYDYCEAAPSKRAALLASSLFQAKEIERDL